MYRLLNCEIPDKTPVPLNFSPNWIPIDILGVVLYLFLSLGYFFLNFWGAEEMLLPSQQAAGAQKVWKTKATRFQKGNIHIEASRICHARKFLIYNKIVLQLLIIALKHWNKWSFNSDFIKIYTLRKQSQFYMIDHYLL